jgi:hypothetical protein
MDKWVSLDWIVSCLNLKIDVIRFLTQYSNIPVFQHSSKYHANYYKNGQ